MAARPFAWENSNTISFAARLASSSSFQSLFSDGMGLVEAAAAYLDGPGRLESKLLPRAAALRYATESMRLTTRLMQIASWLLLQRAVNEGEMTFDQASSDKHKIKLVRQPAPNLVEAAVAPLPARLQDLIGQSIALQERLIRLDAQLYGAPAPAATAALPRAVEAQMQRVREAFCM